MDNTSNSTAPSSESKSRQTWLFPRLPIRDVKFIVDKIEAECQGEKMRRTLLLDACNLADSGPTRAKLIVSQSYGLTKGSYNADFIEPTTLGRRLATLKYPHATIMLQIICGNEYFKKFHDKYADKRVPSEALLIDWAKQVGVPEGQARVFADVVLKNAVDAGLIAKRSGADSFLSFDEAKEIASHSNQQDDTTLDTRKSAPKADHYIPSISDGPLSSDNQEGTNIAMPIAKRLIFHIARDCDTEINFFGQVTEEAISKLIKYLELAREDYPSRDSLIVEKIQRNNTNNSGATPKNYEKEDQNLSLYDEVDEEYEVEL